MIFFAFFVYKNVSQKNTFCIQMKITMTAISERQRARLYIYKKQKKLRYVFIYKNPDTSQKARQFPLRFYIQKDNLRYTIFMKILKSAFIYKKHDTLHYVTFLYLKTRHFAKSKTICVVFLYIKIWTLCFTRFFIEFLK